MRNKLVIFLLSFLSFTSCEDTLNSRLSASVEEDELITDLESLDIATIGTYSIYQDEDLFGRTLLLLPALLSDNAYMNVFDNTGRYLDYDVYGQTEYDGYASSTWDDLYSVVAQTSVILRQAEQVDFSEEDKANHYLGESHALRALAFLYLQQFYAQPYNFTADASHSGVPIPDFELVGGVEIIAPARNTTAQVYSQIVNDLTSAISLLDEKENGPERITIGAAKALLARTYLNMENWDGAGDMADEVIHSQNYRLVENDNYVDSWSLDSNSETIFTVVNTLTDNPGSGSISYFYLNYVDAFASEDLVSIYHENDIRKELYPYSESDENYLITKFPKFVNSDDNIQVIRLSEMYLIKSEAHARLGETKQAQDALDAIRLRAHPQASPTSLTGNELLEAIMEERRKELAFEGFRLFDLTRTGTTFTKFRQDGSSEIDAPENKTILPIPISEINRNANLNREDQNPGY